MAKNKKDEENMEDDWFEDDDENLEDEEKPKKKSGKKKKRSYAWVWILAFVVILLILLLVRYKYAGSSADEAVDTDAGLEEEPEWEEDTVYVPEKPSSEEEYDSEEGYERVYDVGERAIGPAVVTDEEMLTGEYEQQSLLGEPTNQDEEHARDLTAEPELFSNLDCQYDYETGIPYISLRIYNTLDEDILISPKGVAKGYNTYFMIRGIVDTDPGCGTEVLEPGQYTECNKIGFDGEKYANVAGINRISVEVPKRTEALLIDCPEPPVFEDEEEE